MVPDAPPLSSSARRLLLLTCALAFLVGACSTRDLWAPDEPRYGQVARETLAHGQWLVPHVNGAPYAEKPPLYFWVAATFARPFGGVTAITARLAAALFAAGAVLLTYGVAKRLLDDPDRAATAACLFASLGLVLWNGPRAALDLPLTFFVLLAVERGAAWWTSGRWTAAGVAGVAWAGAILVKGPVGAFLPPLVLGAGMLAARRAPSWRNPGWWLMPVVCVGLCLAWLLPALEAGGAAYADRLLGQLADRATGAEGGHRRGLFYYLLRVGPVTMPWALHLLAGLGVLFAVRGASRERRFALGLCGAGTLGLLVILSLFATKRELYLLPALPFAAVLAAVAVHEGRAMALQRWGRWLVVLSLAGLAAGVVVFPFALAWFGEAKGYVGLEEPDLPRVVASVAAGVGLGAAAFVLWKNRGRAVRAVHLGACFLLLGAAFVHVALLPLADPAKSFARCAEAAEAAADAGPILYSGWGQGPNLLWSLDRERVTRVEEPEDLAARLAPDAPRAAAVVRLRHWTYVTERCREIDATRYAYLERVPVAWQGRVGNRTLVVVSNASPR